MPVGECMTEEQYYCIAHACDNLLQRSDAPLEWIAIPWLHVLNEHPIHLAGYTDLVINTGLSGEARNSSRSFGSILKSGCASAVRSASLTRNLVRAGAAMARRSEATNRFGTGFQPLSKSPQADVIIVSWLVNVDHLDKTDDFYFGNLQSILADRGLSSLLVLRNQTGFPTHNFVQRAERDGACRRMVLPDVGKLTEELGFIGRCRRARRQLRQAELEARSLLDRQVARNASKQVLSSAVVANLRLHEQISHLCRQFRPSIVMTLYEGHAWERCVWHGARTGIFPVLCVGYQHTVLRKHPQARRETLAISGAYRSLQSPDSVGECRRSKPGHLEELD